jgi:3-oxoacyl-[acyl-carrier protein] reductase
MSDPLDFTGKVVLVTGSSRGLGAEIIKAFDGRGAQGVINFISDPEGKNKADAEEVARELKNPTVVDCDVTKPGEVEAMMKEIADKFQGLDVLVNNSGIIRDRTIRKLTLEEFENVVRVNLAGTFNVTQKAASVLRQGGRIINLSSVSGQMGLFGQANYSSSKAAIIALTKVSAREFARQQITVNAIAPGFIATDMTRITAERLGVGFEEFQEARARETPVPRVGQPEDIAHAVSFFVSEGASFVTGQVLYVAGGPRG